ncbi:DNA adenine methylase [Bradyrhizobium diazoefficiens]|uniref:DNA adenine methylase n=1 Tax=Bradyrhizobium diazoefficiens TaxID=1355477 RepID=UPI0034E4B4D9
MLQPLRAVYPLDRRVYIEPFCGSAALFFDQKPRRAVLSDINSDLINFYKCSREQPDLVYTIATGLRRSKATYLRVRREIGDTSDKFRRAAYFSGFRSIDQRLVLKLATSPFSKIDWRGLGKDRPMSGNDYTPINLGFTTKHDTRRNDARRFSSRLLEALIVSEGRIRQRDHRPLGTLVLGRSPISEANTSPDQRRRVWSVYRGSTHQLRRDAPWK